MMKYILFPVLVLMISYSCINRRKQDIVMNQPRDFDASVLINDMPAYKTVRGQILYMPVYSNIPYQIDTGMFDMSAFVSIHNTDFLNSINLSQVLYFNQDGKLVDDFLKGATISIGPLSTKEYYIPYEDKSGTGANFLIEWSSDSLVTEPLIESVTLSLKPNNTIAIRSGGKIVKEKK